MDQAALRSHNRGFDRDDRPGSGSRSCSVRGERGRQDHQRQVVVLGNPYQYGVGAEIRSEAAPLGGLAVGGIAHQHPDDVRQPLAAGGAVRVARLVRVLMVDAVGCHPGDRAACERKCPAEDQETSIHFGVWKDRCVNKR